MAYSSWTSDLKTRSSVGFLGKVVNLLVQAKDRLNTLHTTVTTAGGQALSFGAYSSGEVSGTEAIAVLQTGAGSPSVTTLTIADGGVHGQHKRIYYQTQDAAKDIRIDFTAGRLIGLNSSSQQYLTFTDQAEWAEIIWSTESPYVNKWVLGSYSGITH